MSTDSSDEVRLCSVCGKENNPQNGCCYDCGGVLKEGMQEVTLNEVLGGLSEADLANLLSLLGGKSEVPTVQNVEEQFKWLYHSKLRASAEVGLASAFKRVFSNPKEQAADSNGTGYRRDR